MTIILKRNYTKNYTEGELSFQLHENTNNEFFSCFKNQIKHVIKGEIIKTLELPFNNNKRFISCIPEGNYIIKIHNSPSKGKCIKIYNLKTVYPINYWEVKDGKRRQQLMEYSLVFDNLEEVKDREHILIHSGNTVADFEAEGHKYKKESEGCILVGLKIDKIEDTETKKQAILRDSRKALDILIKYLESNKGIDELIINNGRQSK